MERSKHMSTKKPAVKKPKAAAKPKAKSPAKPRVAKVASEPRVKHAPEPGPHPQRQAKGWSNGLPTAYED